MEALARALAVDLAPMGITVNCVAPGYIQKDPTAHAALAAENLALATATMFAAALGAGVVGALDGTFHPIWVDFGTRELTLVAYAVATAVAFLLFYKIVDIAGAVYLGQVGYLVTLFGVGWGVLFFSESTTIWLWAAVLVVGFGVALVNLGKHKVTSDSPAEPG